jgi:seryl-tRNA synthetase
MYDIKWIRENLPLFERGMTRRGMPESDLRELIQRLTSRDQRRRAIIRVREDWLARRNAASKMVHEAIAKKDEVTANRLKAEVAESKTSISTLDREQKEVEQEISSELAELPNIPLDDVPDGKDEHDNVEHHVFGEKPAFAFAPRQHFELGEALGMMDFELAAKLSGARFVVLQKGLARLERALGQFMLDLHTGEEHGYTEVNPPILVRDEVMFGTAQLPKFVDDQFSTHGSIADEDVEKFFDRFGDDETYVEKKSRENEAGHLETKGVLTREGIKLWNAYRDTINRYWLIPTAEVPLTNLVRESIVDEATLPMRFTACTPCFRAEAGAAGKDTRGMIRQHQFTKVELVSITTLDESKKEHDRMLTCAEDVLKKLGLHYRVVTLCTGDMGFASQKTFDIEVWLPGQNAYREISSCSVCGEFQARRMNARYRGKDGKPQFVHTLNGSGVAVGRALIAVMENYQQEDGSILVPEALKPYMGGMTKIENAK